MRRPGRAGINFVDTADVYSRGESEEIVGKALATRRRDEVVLATKFGLPVGGDPNRQGASPRWIARAVEASLRRLDTDYIDLYQLHRPDYTTDLDETLGALSDLIRAGKVRAIGSSMFPADLVVEAQWVAERRGHHRFRTEQPRYSILTRTIEGTVLPAAQRHGMGVLSYSPMSSPDGFVEMIRPHSGPSDEDSAPGIRPEYPGQPGQAGSRRCAERVGRQGWAPLTHLATAFVGVTAGSNRHADYRAADTGTARQPLGRSRRRAQ